MHNHKKPKVMRIISFLAMAVILAACGANGEKSDAYGNFESGEIIVSAEAMGTIRQLQLENGDKLSKGDVVGQIDTTQLHLKKQQIKAQRQSVASEMQNVKGKIDVLRAQKDNALTEKRRLTNLMKDSAATQREMDNITGKIEVLNQRIKSTRSRMATIRAKVSSVNRRIDQINEKIANARITNPRKGTVLKKYAEEGEMIRQGKPIYKIADLSTLDLRVYVDGGQLPDIENGQEVEVLVDKNDTEEQQFTGTVTWIASDAEFTPKTIQTKEVRVDLVYAVKVKVPNDGTLKIGMPGEVNF